LFKTSKIDFMKGTGIGDRIDEQSVLFLVVHCEMLDRGTHTLGLDSLDVCQSHLSRKKRVFGEVFEIPPAERGAFDVHSWSEDHRDTFGQTFLAQSAAELGDQGWIPSGGHGGRGGKAGGGDAAARP
jgi:hypothetical protein